MKYIYDLETYPNFFLASFKSVKSDKYYEFEISDRKSDCNELRRFLSQKGLKLIGFNNINFDYPVLHNTILSDNTDWDAYSIYVQVELIIRSEYSSIWDNKVKIPQLDLFKIWHYDNKNKSTSLKWLEFAMRLRNVADLPYAPGTNLEPHQMDEIIKYCRNDLDATHEFFNRSSKHIAIRQFYTKQEGINLINASEIKMSKEIFGKYLSEEMNISKKDLFRMRTNRSSFRVSDVIFDYLPEAFTDDDNMDTLCRFSRHMWVDTSDMSKEKAKSHAVKFSKKYKNVIREYAEGGLHSFGKAGIYKSDADWVLVDVDFASYYPHISFRNGLHPEHIPAEVFNELYEGFYKTRKEYPKSDPRNYVLKIILNGSYGLSKDKYAFLFDPKWQMAICINGQLILTLLTEKIFDLIPEASIMFENTDGAMYRIPRYKLPLLEHACGEVETIVDIPLEIQECDTLIARDVNNYINIIEPGYEKFKGVFEIDRDYHKNHSKRIVSLALANYFINGVSVEESIYNHLDRVEDYSFGKVYGIYDFCIGSKMKGKNTLVARTVQGVNVIDKPLNKMNRYYISTEGVELIKVLPPLNTITETDKHKSLTGEAQVNIFDFIEDVQVGADDRESNLESGWKCTLFNIYHARGYDINYEYYIQECYKVINSLK